LKKKILLFGGAGFIGFHLASKLSKKFEVDILDNFSRGKNDKYLKEIKNISVKKISDKSLEKININRYSHVFYLAAIVGVQNVIFNPSKTLSNNILPLLKIIDLIKKSNKKIRLVFFSTSEVYSPAISKNKIKFPLREDSEIFLNEIATARDSYYLSKIFGEQICHISNIDYICLRPHNVYGPRMGYAHVVPEIIEKFKKKSLINVFSPNHKRAFCYIDDAINQIEKLSFKKNNKFTTYNIGNMDEEISIINLIQKLKKLLNSTKRIIRAKNTKGSPVRRVPSMNRTIKETNYKNLFNLNDGLKKTIKWYLHNEK